MELFSMRDARSIVFAFKLPGDDGLVSPWTRLFFLHINWAVLVWRALHAISRDTEWIFVGGALCVLLLFKWASGAVMVTRCGVQFSAWAIFRTLHETDGRFVEGSVTLGAGLAANGLEGGRRLVYAELALRSLFWKSAFFCWDKIYVTVHVQF
jgi:hypothetical protein